ncbi:MAG: hypothetical protein D6701_07780, partial [Gemmatimonadetes bacterium]
MARAAPRDPRTIITPDAFAVDPELLGTPLARPGRRALALLLDLFFVGMITVLTSGVWFVLGVVIAGFFLNRARLGGRGGDRLAAVFRVFLGCMGLAALSLTLLVWGGLRWLDRSGVGDDLVAALERLEEEGTLPEGVPVDDDGNVDVAALMDRIRSGDLD